MDLKDFPSVKGKLVKDYPLKNRTWFHVGGLAEWYFEPEDEEDLKTFLTHRPDMPVTFLGGGSNVLISDEGIPGVVIHLGAGFSFCHIDGTTLEVGAGYPLVRLSADAAKASLTGFEGFCKIPGTVGGGVRTNAGAYGVSLGERMIALEGDTLAGEKKVFDPQKDNIFAYRKCTLPPDFIVTKCVFQAESAPQKDILDKMAENVALKEKTQPINAWTAGSTFKNPEGNAAWRLIAEAGLQGKIIGGAQVSLKHANFIENMGTATATDINNLCTLIQKTVLEKSGITLELEIQKLGHFD